MTNNAYLPVFTMQHSNDGDTYVGIFTNKKDLKSAIEDILLNGFEIPCLTNGKMSFNQLEKEESLYPEVRILNNISSLDQKIHFLFGKEKI